MRLHARNILVGSNRSIVEFCNHPVGESADSTAERFEPSSRTFLIGEQPNAWDLLQPRAKVSRHRYRHFTLSLLRGSDYIFILSNKRKEMAY